MIQPIIIFPHNNPFVKNYKKPVVLSAFSYIKYSMYVNDLIVITPYAKEIENICNVKVVSKECSVKNKYKYQVNNILKTLNPSTIEVHQDLKLAGYLAKKFPHIKVSLIKHGEYLVNRFKENMFFYKFYYQSKYLQYLDKVFCISDYVKNTLSNNYPKYKNKFNLLYNSYGHIQDTFEKNSVYHKKNQIIFVGKPIKAKGIVELLESIPMILENYPDYEVILIGGFFSKKHKYAKVLNKFLSKKLYKNYLKQNKLQIYSNLSSQEVFQYLQNAKIATMLTKKPEPFGLVALEYHLAKCVVISSGTGGLKEISSNNAFYIKEVSATNVFYAVSNIINNYENIYTLLSNNGYNYVKERFNILNLVKMIDFYRGNDERI